MRKTGGRQTALLPAALIALALASCGEVPVREVASSPIPTPAPVNTVPFNTVPFNTVPAGSERGGTPADLATKAVPGSAGDLNRAPADRQPANQPVTQPDPPPPNAQFDGLSFELELVAPVDKPTAVAWAPGDDAMYVSTQPGPIVRVAADGTTTTVIDLTSETFEDLPGSERGILGVAFDPRDGRMFVNFTDTAQDTRVVSYLVVDGVALPESRREVLSIDQPAVGHNGGRLLFDAAGNLYIGSGDGGGSNGRDAQDTTKLLGAILRITPKLDDGGYDIPADNPFADGSPRAGTDRPEIWARGFRNPWTFSIDEPTGDMWIGDVGNDEYEEISVMRGGTSGLNFGWYWFEGNNERRSGAPDGLVPPVFDYSHAQGVAVMGGYVYRGEQIPELRGVYLFGDLTGPVYGIGEQGVSRLDVPTINTLTGWGEDPDGELYVLSLIDGVSRLVRSG